jgi:elongation factor Ts
VDAAEDKISAEFVEATEEIDNVPELNVEAATIQQEQPPLADDETDEQLHEAADDQIAAELVEAVQDLEKTATLAAEEINIENKFDAEVEEKRKEAPTPLNPEEDLKPVAVTEETLSIPESEEPSPSIPGAFALETDSMTTTVSDPVVEPEIGLVTESVVETAVAEQPSTTNASVNVPTAVQVKELRELTGAGMMECKKALVACESDVAKASEYLRKKGLASAEKKASRIAAEGLVGSYVHDGRIGVLIEVNCETDFVSRGDQFKELVADMGMQVVACPSVEVVTVEDVPAEFVAKEKEIESEKDDLAKKPPQIREKIVDGRVAKRLAELALLEQPYIRDDKILVKDLVKQTIAGLGEKVQVCFYLSLAICFPK